MDKSFVFETIGNIELLSHNRVAIFCSRSYPAEAEAAAKRLVTGLSQLSLVFAGGWQAPFEKQIYKQLKSLNNSIQFIHYLARDINTHKLNSHEQKQINEKRLLLIAPELSYGRANAKQVSFRDHLIFEQNKKILFFGLTSGGRLEKHLKELSAAKYQLYILDHPINQIWYGDDLIPLNPDNLDLLVHT